MPRSTLAGFSGLEKLAIIVAALSIIVGLVIGWVALVTLLVNFVLAYFGVKPVGMLLVWACMLLLSVIGGYFKHETRYK